MGIAVPGALAAKLLRPEHRILAVSGDGGFNASAYGLIQWKQNDRFGHTNMTSFHNPDFVQLAQSMGCMGYRVQEGSDLCAILEDAFRQDVPAVIDCPVDYGENALLTKRLQALVKEYQ